MNPGGLSNDEFSRPWGVSVEPGRDRVYVADEGNDRVQVLTTGGRYVYTLQMKQPGDGFTIDKDEGPIGVCVDPGPDNHLYVVDTPRQRILVFLKA